MAEDLPVSLPVIAVFLATVIALFINFSAIPYWRTYTNHSITLLLAGSIALLVVSSTQQFSWRPPLFIETCSLSIVLSLALASLFIPIYFSIEASSVAGKLIDLVRGAEPLDSFQAEDTDRNTIFGNLFALLAMSVWFSAGGFINLLSLAVGALGKAIAANASKHTSTFGHSIDSSMGNSMGNSLEETLGNKLYETLGTLTSATIDAVIATLANCAVLVLPVIAVAVLIDLSGLAIGRMTSLPNIGFELNCLKQLAALLIVAHLMGNELVTMIIYRGSP